MEDKNFIKVYFADFSVFDEATISARICEISEDRRARIEKAARTETKLELLASGLLAKKAVSIVFGIENPEFVKVVVDGGDRIISAVRRDGTIILSENENYISKI